MADSIVDQATTNTATIPATTDPTASSTPPTDTTDTTSATNTISTTPSSTEYYEVYWIESFGMPRNHIAIFVETHELRSSPPSSLSTTSPSSSGTGSGTGSGHNYQVSGSIQQGMFHNHRPGKRPEDDEQSAFVSKRPLGRVRKQVYDDGTFQRVCDGVEPPPKQFDGVKRLVPKTKLVRCGEWAGMVVARLMGEGVLVPLA